MSTLPPPPIQGWSDIPPVWRRWFQILFGRVGGSSSGGLDELEERVAGVSERPDVASLESRIAALEEQLAILSAPKIGELTARVDDLERAIHA